MRDRVTGPSEAVMLGAILASPFIFFFIWQFVAAGLYPHEQRYVHIFLPFSLALFLAGAASKKRPGSVPLIKSKGKRKT